MMRLTVKSVKSAIQNIIEQLEEDIEDKKISILTERDLECYIYANLLPLIIKSSLEIHAEIWLVDRENRMPDLIISHKNNLMFVRGREKPTYRVKNKQKVVMLELKFHRSDTADTTSLKKKYDLWTNLGYDKVITVNYTRKKARILKKTIEEYEKSLNLVHNYEPRK